MAQWSATQVSSYLAEHEVEATVQDAVTVAVKKHAARPIADIGLTLLAGKSAPEPSRPLSLPKSVAAFGGLAKWNAQPRLAQQIKMLNAACTAATVAEALEEVRGIMNMGHNLWAYSYLRKLYAKDPNLYYGALAADPALLLPVAYTPTVGEACQKFGKPSQCRHEFPMMERLTDTPKLVCPGVAEQHGLKVSGPHTENCHM